ncbi:MAG: helix-turn-helix transcriptional regulator [Candidatus Obscuribacterales bacterium]|nr:helix-turn-helix transcriptional regulator [Candidatus Obscuribacterales bacterium]
MNSLENGFDNGCPIDLVLNLLSAKWTVQILRELALGPVRSRRFLRLIQGLSMKSLQERLKALHLAGMIKRVDYEEKIPHVEYSITERGRRLFTIMSEVKDIAAEIVEHSCKCSIEGFTEAEMQCPSRRLSKAT